MKSLLIPAAMTLTLSLAIPTAAASAQPSPSAEPKCPPAHAAIGHCKPAPSEPADEPETAPPKASR